jgi:hypothetical protein
MNIVQEVGILLLPISLVRTLQISRSRKRGLAVMITLSTWWVYIKTSYENELIIF